MDQNILLNKPEFLGDSYCSVNSNCIDKCNIPIDCDTLLKVMHRDVQGGNVKNSNITYPKKMTVTQDTSTNTNNRITVTQDASVNTSKRIDKGSDY